ncbi:hypothetical protein I5555_10890 [Acinetobacter baumannii]|uniref:hypothetical protein n=1 Tax=Acinetobacter baumannii TaxID=470 RepID=UPI00190023D5|nr:hypothetical protein [Acinetobacter baumannii]MBJ9442947.1 hypothetical protein [Acinetobacter baumannii]
MAEIIGEGNWAPVRILEDYELARGGINGNMNEQAKALVDRTEFLKNTSATKDELSSISGGSYAFGTKAQAEAAGAANKLPANSKIEVQNDGTNNGYYRWTGSALVPSDFNPLNGANGYTDEKFLEANGISRELYQALAKYLLNVLFLQNNSDGSLIKQVDQDGEAFYHVDKDTRFWFAGLAKDLVTEIYERTRYETGTDIEVKRDPEGEEYFKIDKDTKFWFAGLTQDLVTELYERTRYETGTDIEVKRDPEGEEYFKIDKDTKFWFAGLAKDLVTEIYERTRYETGTDIEVKRDVDGEEYYKVDKNTKFWFAGLETDLVTAINSKAESGLSLTDTSNLTNYSYRDTFIPKAERLLSFFRNTQNSGLLAPVPLHSFEQNFSISDTWLDQAKISTWGNYIPVKTPYGDDRGVVHPQILEFPNKFMGYRYIVSITGYTNGALAEENPFLLGSNDLQKFDLLTGLIDEPDSYTWEHGTVYNSDVFTFYDVKTGELCMVFRTYWADTDNVAPNESHEKLFIRRTKDGKTWSDREVLNDKFPLVAPAVIYDAKTETYHLYGVDNGIRHYTSKTAKNDWNFVGVIPAPADKAPWHVDVKFIGDKQVIVVHDRIWSPSSKNRGFFLGIASDFHNFKWASDFWNTDTRGIYKATFLPQFNDQNQLRLMCLWTSDSSNSDINLRYKLFVQPTPFIDVNFVEK